jgi:hypothetical protein
MTRRAIETNRRVLIFPAAIAMLPLLILFALPALARGAEIERARLLGYGDVAGHTVGVDVEAGWCVGQPKPRIDHLKVTEHGRSASWPKGYVVVTAFVIRERSLEAEEAEAEGRPTTCKAVTANIFKHIKLRRPAAGLPILDGFRRPYRRAPLLEPL